MDAILDFFTQSAFGDGLTGTQVLTSLTVAFVCGVIIFLVYRFFNRTVIYSPRFNMLIVMVSVVTALIIITIGTNLVLTLGMVGALSIVRFRAAVKDPLDVGFLFWGIAAGLTSGAQLYTAAIIGTAFVAVVYIFLTLVRFDKHSYLLIIRYATEVEGMLEKKVEPLRGRIKNKTTSDAFSELTLEVKLRRADSTITSTLKKLDGVETVTLVEYTGDYS